MSPEPATSTLEHEYPVPSDLDDPRFRWAFDYWRNRFRGDLLPGRGDIDPTDYRRINSALTFMVERRQPHFWQIPVPFNNRGFLSFRRLLLPLAADGQTVDTLFALMIENRADPG
jgi:hypothetical protein